MKGRSTYLLVATFAALILVAYFLLRSPEEREASYSLEDSRFSMDSSQVSSVKIVRPATSLSLKEIGGTWYVVRDDGITRYPADENSVKRLFSSLHNLKVRSLISSNPQKQDLFQVDSTGTQLLLTDRNGKTSALVVGKMGPSFSETYIRPAASNNVYLAEGISSWDVNKEFRDWREKTILKVVEDSLRGLNYRYAKDQFSLTRDSLWRIKKDTVSSTAVSGVLNTLANLRADDFVDSSVRIPAPQLRLDLGLSQQVSLNFSPMPPDSSRYWVTSSATPQTFIMNKWSVQNILKQRKDFLPSRK